LCSLVCTKRKALNQASTPAPRNLVAAAVDQIPAVVAEVVDEIVARRRHRAAQPGLGPVGVLVATFLGVGAADRERTERDRSRNLADLHPFISSLIGLATSVLLLDRRPLRGAR
jgi:hypothetical protein